VRAARVVSDGARLCFEDQVNGRWQGVLTVPVERVACPQRRVNESSGWRWILARPTMVPGPHLHY
jgi:hypothetical protein